MKLLEIKLLLTLTILLSACGNADSQKKPTLEKEIKTFGSSSKINGVNFVAPPREIDQTWTKDLQKVNAGWVALVPYAFSKVNTPHVFYDGERQYWGESSKGIRTNIKQAHQAGLKVMIKPQVWMQGSWIGDFDLQTEKEWKIWETDYEKYIMNFAKIGAEENVEMICLGTEYRNAVKKRPQFWVKLAVDIRKIYKGKLTYCANWDDYMDVTFWKSLDYIGISGYFPLLDVQTPTVTDLIKAWQPVKQQLKIFSRQQGKPVIFTEYGYRSMDQPAWRSWEQEYKEQTINFSAQANAYEALYQTFWKEKWFAGGFAWKWYSSFKRQDAKNNHDWTPQNKPAQEIMKKYYEMK